MFERRGVTKSPAFHLGVFAAILSVTPVIAAPPPTQAADPAPMMIPAVEIVQQPDTPANARTTAVLRAEQAITAGHAEDARAMLETLAASPTGQTAADNQVLFLLGMLDIAEQDYDSAIARFHRILVSEPRQVRVRLELGRAYFMHKDFANAQRQFLFARAGHLPPTVQANVDGYLGAIRALQTFTYSVSFALATDTNLNAGPATDSVSLYGLPFQLSPNARANSGVGLALDAGVEVSPVISRRLKWRLGSQIHRSQYRQSQFDDMTLGQYTGPHLTLKRWDFNLLVNIARRWYGDRTYNNSYGGSLDTTWYATARLGLGASMGLSHLSYLQAPLQNGLGYTYAANLFYTPTPASMVRANASFGTQQAQIAAYANHSQQLGLVYSREFRGGLTVSLTPSLTRIGYDGALEAFGTTRIDHQVTGQVSVLDRKIDWDGFTPRVVYTYTRNRSSIPLYAFNRSRVEFGFTRAF
jgi:hypothetical protein